LTSQLAKYYAYGKHRESKEEEEKEEEREQNSRNNRVYYPILSGVPAMFPPASFISRSLFH
jgi:uncharacterized protein YbaR (Trm112 family)